MKEKSSFIGTVSLIASFALLLLLPVWSQEEAKKQGDLCRKTSADELKACSSAARGNLWLASAKCENLATAAERQACLKQAAKDHKSANEECQAQNKARLAVCKGLGNGAYNPPIQPSDFVEVIDNPFFPLHPGTTFIYENHTASGTEHVEVKVTQNRRTIMGVSCLEVRDTVSVDGEVIEDTLDWYAQDRAGSVWYFGENSKQYANGLIVGLAGSWIGGENGAKPGLIMETHPQAGQLYRQEYLPGSAEDMAEILALDASVTVPQGSYTSCLKTKDFSPLEPDAIENKFYAPGVGLVKTIDMQTGDHEDLIDIVTE